jgi:hypothetical protein
MLADHLISHPARLFAIRENMNFWCGFGLRFAWFSDWYRIQKFIKIDKLEICKIVVKNKNLLLSNKITTIKDNNKKKKGNRRRREDRDHHDIRMVHGHPAAGKKADFLCTNQHKRKLETSFMQFKFNVPSRLFIVSFFICMLISSIYRSFQSTICSCKKYRASIKWQILWHFFKNMQ